MSGRGERAAPDGEFSLMRPDFFPASMSQAVGRPRWPAWARLPCGPRHRRRACRRCNRRPSPRCPCTDSDTGCRGGRCAVRRPKAANPCRLAERDRRLYRTGRRFGLVCVVVLMRPASGRRRAAGHVARRVGGKDLAGLAVENVDVAVAVEMDEHLARLPFQGYRPAHVLVDAIVVHMS